MFALLQLYFYVCDEIIHLHTQKKIFYCWLVNYAYHIKCPVCSTPTICTHESSVNCRNCFGSIYGCKFKIIFKLCICLKYFVVFQFQHKKNYNFAWNKRDFILKWQKKHENALSLVLISRYATHVRLRSDDFRLAIFVWRFSSGSGHI